jgi:hypothetical protein
MNFLTMRIIKANKKASNAIQPDNAAFLFLHMCRGAIKEANKFETKSRNNEQKNHEKFI